MFFVQNLISLQKNTQDFDFIKNHKSKLIVDGTMIALIALIAGLILGRVIPLPVGVGVLTDKIIYGVIGSMSLVAICDVSFVLKHLINSPFAKEELIQHYFDACGNQYTLKEITFGFRTAKGFNSTVSGGYILASNPLLTENYKVQLMPKPEQMHHVVSRLVEKIARDAELKHNVAQYQVMLGEKNIDGEVVLADSDDPRIVIYAKSKEAAQLILKKLREAFSDPETKGVVNSIESMEINHLIFHAHDSLIKHDPLDDLLDEELSITM